MNSGQNRMSSFSSLSDFSIEKEKQQSDDFNNSNENISINFESDLSSINNDEEFQIIQENVINPQEIVENKKKREKMTKEDLNKTPLPIFECIYCSNQIVAMKHLSNEIISEKYIYNLSPYDIKLLNEILGPNPDLTDNKDNIIKKIIIHSTEYLKDNYCYEKSKEFLSSNVFNEKCEKEKNLMKNKLSNKIVVFMEKKKLPTNVINSQKNAKNGNNNVLKFQSNSTNSIINNVNVVNSFSNLNNNSSINSISLGCNNNNVNIDNFKNESNKQGIQMNSIGMDSIAENKDNPESEESQEDFFNFLKFDLKRKITKEEIEWEDEVYDIWNPIFCDIDNEVDNNIINNTANCCGDEESNKQVKQSDYNTSTDITSQIKV